MAKLTLNTIGSRYGSIDALNDNFNAIETAIENTFSLDGTSPNALEADLDLNSNDLLNVGTTNTQTLYINGVEVEPSTGVTAGSAFQTYSFTATAGQTTFSVAPATPLVSSLLVSVNGLELPPADVTVSTTNVVIPACTLGDEVVVRRFTKEPTVYPTAATQDFQQAGTGAQIRTVQSKLRDVVSVKDFGAVGDGAADDTTAINNALLAVNALGNVSLYFPAGIYRYAGGGWLGNGVVITGAGRDATTIRSIQSNPIDGYLFDCRGYGSGIRSMRFDALGTTQTGGSYVWLKAPESFIDDFHMTNDINGILMTGNVSRIRHGRFQDGASGAIRIRAEGGDNSQLIDDVLMGAQLPQVSSAGIRVRNSSALIISNTSVIQQGHGLLIDPYTSTQGAATDAGSVFSLYANNCFFDNSSGSGIRITPSGTGSVVRCRFANCWASSSGSDGIALLNTGTGLLAGMHFESTHAVLNAGSGVTSSGTISDISFVGGEFCENSYGFYFNNATTNLRITNATIGTGAGLSGNTNAAIVLAAAPISNVIITGNFINGNGGGIANSSTGTDINISNNSGSVAEVVSWTPVITFGGASVGVTYGTQVGSALVTGSMVRASFKIILTSKGTSTGTVFVGGLPYTVSASGGRSGGGVIANVANMTGLTSPLAIQATGGASSMAVVQTNATGFANVTDAAVTNTTVLYGELTYYRN